MVPPPPHLQGTGRAFVGQLPGCHCGSPWSLRVGAVLNRYNWWHWWCNDVGSFWCRFLQLYFWFLCLCASVLPWSSNLMLFMLFLLFCQLACSMCNHLFSLLVLLLLPVLLQLSAYLVHGCGSSSCYCSCYRCDVFFLHMFLIFVFTIVTVLDAVVFLCMLFMLLLLCFVVVFFDWMFVAGCAVILRNAMVVVA